MQNLTASMIDIRGGRGVKLGPVSLRCREGGFLTYCEGALAEIPAEWMVVQWTVFPELFLLHFCALDYFVKRCVESSPMT